MKKALRHEKELCIKIVQEYETSCEELRILVVLGHSSLVVKLLDTFEVGNTRIFVFPWLSGVGIPSTHKEVKHILCGILRVRRAYLLLFQALLYIHEQSVVHLDVKVSNLMLDESNNVVLVDFGLAQFVNWHSPYTIRGSDGTNNVI